MMFDKPKSEKRYRFYDYNDHTGNFRWWDSYETFDEATDMAKIWFDDAPGNYFVYDTDLGEWFIFKPDLGDLAYVW